GGDQESAQTGEQQGGEHGQEHHQDGTAEHHGEVLAGLAVHDVAAESAHTDVGGDGGGGHDLYGRGTHAVDDERDGHGQLQARQHLVPAHAHAERGVLQRGFDLAYPFVGVDQDRRNGEGDQGDNHGHQSDTCQQHDEEEHTDGGQGAGEVGQARGREPADPGVPGDEADRDRDESGDQQSDQGVLEVFCG